MRRIETDLPDVCVIEPHVFSDNRGFFFESFNEEAFASIGINVRWVQDNHSKSAAGVLRGLHYQRGASAQDKLVRVSAGAAYDVVVDLRSGSSTYGRWTGVELSEKNKKMLFVPRGFAHGFLSLADGTEFLYKCSHVYDPAAEAGVVWNDSDLAIEWPLHGLVPQLSERDRL